MAFYLTTFLAWLHFPVFGHSASSQLFVFTPDFIQGTSITALDGLLTTECKAAMEAPIACSPSLKDSSVVGRLNDGETDFCSEACEQSLSHYHDLVLWACRHSPDPWPGVSATVYGDVIWINYNYTCGKGPVAELYDHLDDEDNGLDEDSPDPYVILDPIRPPYPTSSAYSTSNNADSSSPLTVQGKSKRDILRDSGKRNWSVAAACQQYTIQSGDTCLKIANTYRVTVAQLRAWNSFINADCTNLNIGDQLCVSDPVPPGNQTVTTPTQSAPTQSVPYATATVAPPGPVARGTTSKCGRYYLAQAGDYCQRIVANAGISMELFKAINPDINADCTNLISGLYYCTLPTADWNKPSTTLTTSTSVYVSAPAPTMTGTTPNCYEWYVVQQGDYCAKLESQFNITMAQLQLWNPELNRNCTNLLTGYAYCVHGEASANQPAAAVAQPTN